MFSNILIATDLLPTSDQALRQGLLMAAERGGRVTVLYVLELWMSERRWFADVGEQDLAAHRAFLRREEEAISRELDRRIALVLTSEKVELAGVEAMVRDGRAADVIAAVAAERRSELIVLGKRRGPDTFGSVGHQVAHVSLLPVLIIPNRQRADSPSSSCAAECV